MNYEIPDKIPDDNLSKKQAHLPDQLVEDEAASAPGGKKRVSLILASVLLLGAIGVAGVRSLPAKSDKTSKTKDKKEQIMPVSVATVTQQTVPIQLQAIGTVQAGSTVAVTAQASGKVTGVFFKKGQDVKKGDLLFTIDDRSQAAAIQQAQGTVAKDQAQVQQARAALAKDLGLVRQAEAMLEKDQAQAQFSKSQSERYNNLYKQGAISQDQAQQYATNSRVGEATLQADREAIANAKAVVKGDQAAIETAEAVVSADGAALQNTQVQSSYTKIYAPMDGRAGNILVTEGNVVQANATTPLVTIAQVTPIQVSFSVPEANLPEVQKRMGNGKLKVAVNFAGSNAPIDGVLSFVNNTVDNNTGTIQLIGDFDNRDGKLFPGQFVNTTLTLAQEPNAIVVPDRAVQNGPNGQFVFVVKPDSTVENVPVTVSQSINGLDVIKKGLQPGLQVVTDGQANLVTGSKIRAKTASDDSSNNSSVPNSKSNATGNQNSRRNRASKPAGGGS